MAAPLVPGRDPRPPARLAVLRARPPVPVPRGRADHDPFLVDILGNVFDLYDSIDWWDDANHFANWLFLSLGIGVLLLRCGSSRGSAGLVLAFGATAAIVWELGEYITFIRTNEDEFDTAYTDTLGDRKRSTSSLRSSPPA